jgi:glycosyltransferase involved in cell wall biosynthesis
MAALPGYDWTLKTQPARHFSWRVRASEWIWALQGDADLDREYDLIIATSLSGLSGLKALRPQLARTPVWLYFHENQFAYPLEARQFRVHQVGWQFSSLQNALCSDWVSFNTAFNRDTFFNGLRRMLKRMPERLPGKPVKQLQARSDVLPVPLSDDFAALREHPKEPSLVVWNHRWEWDKAPERFLQALVELKKEGVAFRLAMLGCGGAEDARFGAERKALGDSVVHWGEAESAAYRQWIGRAGIGVSCALHDFQGLAMLELAQAGATVVVPDRVAYPECLPDAHFYKGSAGDAAVDVADLKKALGAALAAVKPNPVPKGCVPEWPALKAAYANRIQWLIGPRNGFVEPPID